MNIAPKNAEALRTADAEHERRQRKTAIHGALVRAARELLRLDLEISRGECTADQAAAALTAVQHELSKPVNLVHLVLT